MRVPLESGIATTFAAQLYERLTNSKLDILFDDSDAAAEEKLKYADLLGIPFQIVTSADLKCGDKGNSGTQFIGSVLYHHRGVNEYSSIYRKDKKSTTFITRSLSKLAMNLNVRIRSEMTGPREDSQKKLSSTRYSPLLQLRLTWAELKLPTSSEQCRRFTLLEQGRRGAPHRFIGI